MYAHDSTPSWIHIIDIRSVSAFTFEISLLLLSKYYRCTQKVSALLESVSMAVHPAVYTITFKRIVRLSPIFLHSIIPWISRSSSKIRRIRQGFTELHQEISLFSTVPYAIIDLYQFSQTKAFVIDKMKPQLLHIIR